MNEVELADKEYYFLQSEIGRYDSLTHGIKNWSITVGFALIAAAFAQKISGLFLLASITSLLFWMTEARWKRYQRLHRKRIEVVESFLNGSNATYDGPKINYNIANGISEYGDNSLVRLKNIVSQELKIMRYSNIRLPHNFVCLFSLILFALSYCGCITFEAAIG